MLGVRGIPNGRGVRGSSIGSRWEGRGRENRWVRGRGVALSVFFHPFCLFSASYPNSSGDAGEIYRTLLPLSGVSQIFIYVNHTILCHLPSG